MTQLRPFKLPRVGGRLPVDDPRLYIPSDRDIPPSLGTLDRIYLWWYDQTVNGDSYTNRWVGKVGDGNNSTIRLRSPLWYGAENTTQILGSRVPGGDTITWNTAASYCYHTRLGIELTTYANHPNPLIQGSNYTFPNGAKLWGGNQNNIVCYPDSLSNAQSTIGRYGLQWTLQPDEPEIITDWVDPLNSTQVYVGLSATAELGTTVNGYFVCTYSQTVRITQPATPLPYEAAYTTPARLKKDFGYGNRGLNPMNQRWGLDSLFDRPVCDNLTPWSASAPDYVWDDKYFLPIICFLVAY